ncbi:bifunctional DNA primase/polymerase [Aestuariivirga sp.]|uniref:bifunctional DNA primase/polymerase n=1 Tax=Aestuariivirga sp. TaxID=2650926 RepID=UPI0039E371B3
MTTLHKALALAAKGFRVFPIPANSKKAVLVDFPNKATTDEAKIREWWTDWDEALAHHNIGISTNDLLVIDIEGQSKSGIPPLETIKKIEAELGKLHFMTDTPSGGYHVYLRLPEGRRVANSVRRLWPGVDTRSWHGYVLADGSVIDDAPYRWTESIPDENRVPEAIGELPIAPDWFLDRFNAPKEKADQPADIDYDTPDAVLKATDFLKRAKPSIQGDGGNDQAYRTACRVRDFAVSEDTALELMCDHWNNRCEPPWSVDELEQAIGNAYRYAQNTPRVPGSEFEAVAIEDAPSPGKSLPLVCEPHGDLDAATIPKRHWLIEGVAARGFVTLVSAPPGSGKTQFLAQLMLSAAYDAPLAGFAVKEATAAWSFNAEDDISEMRRRIAAAAQHHNLRHDARKHDWAINSGVEHPLNIAKWDPQAHRLRIDFGAIENLKANIVKQQIGLLILDPFADLHDAPESDNDAIKRVMGVFTQLAQDCNCAVVIATHTRKLPNASSDGHAGNAESVRGASAMVAKARVVLTLMPMSPKEAKAHHVEPQHQGHYLRIDTAKNNLGPTERGAKPLWMKWESMTIANGDKVGVLAPVSLEKTESRVKKEALPGEEFVDDKAATTANVLEAAGVRPGEEVFLARYKRAIVEEAKKNGLENESRYEKFFTAAVADKVALPAGNGRLLVFRKNDGLHADRKIRVKLLSSNNVVDFPGKSGAANRADVDIHSSTVFPSADEQKRAELSSALGN